MKKFKNIKRYIYMGTIILVCILATSINAGKKEEPPQEKEVTSGKAIVVEDIEEVKEEPKKEEKTEIKPEKNEFILQYPTGGEIIKEFSEGKLVYSETLKDYRVHNGVDIKAEILERVFAAEDGIVESVKNDALMGITVVIDHENGIKTVYSNLSSIDMVKEGDSVKKGQVINGVGDTSLIETGQEAHIHFEMLVEGIYVNPKDYIF